MRIPTPVGLPDRGGWPFDNAGVGSLQVRRLQGGWQDRFRAYVILIDKQEVGRLRRGESARFEFSPGPHTLQVAIDWKRSEAFEISGEESVAFLCGPRRGLTVLNLPKHGEGSYLFLEPDIT
jgi:hypothetical protein